jgi:hypothetical protein
VPPTTPVLFSVFMAGDKFVTAGKTLLLCRRFLMLIKSTCESQWIGLYRETDSNEGPEDQLGADVREANAQIQSGSYIGCFDRPDACDRVVFHRVVVVFIKALPGDSRRWSAHYSTRTRRIQIPPSNSLTNPGPARASQCNSKGTGHRKAKKA